MSEACLFFLTTVSYKKRTSVLRKNQLASMRIYLIKYHRFATESTYRAPVSQILQTHFLMAFSSEGLPSLNTIRKAYLTLSDNSLLYKLSIISHALSDSIERGFRKDYNDCESESNTLLGISKDVT